MSASIEFCDEVYTLDPSRPFSIGRDADLVVDENPFLHRRFLTVSYSEQFWWLANVGAQLSATLADDSGRMQAWLAPGASLPLVFPRLFVWFTAGPTTYELEITTDEAPYASATPESAVSSSTTTGHATLTPEQRLLLLALVEPMLRRGGRGTASVPSSQELAVRLGWLVTKVNRKLDAVCQKLERLGVPGLHGGPGNLASNRKARLAEYALAARLVEADDLALLKNLTPG